MATECQRAATACHEAHACRRILGDLIVLGLSDTARSRTSVAGFSSGRGRSGSSVFAGALRTLSGFGRCGACCSPASPSSATVVGLSERLFLSTTSAGLSGRLCICLSRSVGFSRSASDMASWEGGRKSAGSRAIIQCRMLPADACKGYVIPSVVGARRFVRAASLSLSLSRRFGVWRVLPLSFRAAPTEELTMRFFNVPSGSNNCALAQVV